MTKLDKTKDVTELSDIDLGLEIPETNSRASVIIDRNTNTILYGKNENQKRKMASTTKIMTATLALENLKMEDVVTFSHDAVFSIEPGSSSAYAAPAQRR